MKKSTCVLIQLAVLSFVPCRGADLATPAPTVKDNEEISRLADEDQADRQPKESKPIDWDVVGPRDTARQKRAMELYTAGELKTGGDYFHAALIFQHGDTAQDYLLCHELCVAAVFKSGRSEKAGWLPLAKWLAAASEDRFLESIGRTQRFGTQLTSEGHPDKVEEGVTDAVRKVYGVPTLANGKQRETEMNQKKEPNQALEPTAPSGRGSP